MRFHPIRAMGAPAISDSLLNLEPPSVNFSAQGDLWCWPAQLGRPIRNWACQMEA
jgi:hypothetical protein